MDCQADCFCVRVPVLSTFQFHFHMTSHVVELKVPRTTVSPRILQLAASWVAVVFTAHFPHKYGVGSSRKAVSPRKYAPRECLLYPHYDSIYDRVGSFTQHRSMHMPVHILVQFHRNPWGWQFHGKSSLHAQPTSYLIDQHVCPPTESLDNPAPSENTPIFTTAAVELTASGGTLAVS